MPASKTHVADLYGDMAHAHLHVFLIYFNYMVLAV